jgi:hypothetical protein
VEEFRAASAANAEAVTPLWSAREPH